VNDLPTLDRVRLELITRGKRELAAEFLGALIEESDAILAGLGLLIDSGDCAGISDAAHTLKGMAAELGAMRMRAAAAALETEADAECRPERMAALALTLDELRLELHAPSNP
jgi:HPt (histidine-containing phosphotransfer) domain-containing protein